MSEIDGTKQTALLEDSMADSMEKSERLKQDGSGGLPPLPPQREQKTEKNAPIGNPSGCQIQGTVLFNTRVACKNLRDSL